MSHHSALTPEEWKRRGIPPSDDEHDLYIAVQDDGRLLFDTSGREYAPWDCTSDARKIMALANLSLTLQGKPGSIALPDVAVCQSAAWYFRKLARELIAAAKLKMDPEERASFLDHARSLTDGNEALFRLSETLKALVPPE